MSKKGCWSKDWDVKKLTPEQARAIMFEETKRFDVIEDTIVETYRWSILHKLVIEDTENGKFYTDCYQVGATEYQPERPWEVNDPSFVEVEKVEVIAYKWKKVE